MEIPSQPTVGIQHPDWLRWALENNEDEYIHACICTGYEFKHLLEEWPILRRYGAPEPKPSGTVNISYDPNRSPLPLWLPDLDGDLSSCLITSLEQSLKNNNLDFCKKLIEVGHEYNHDMVNKFPVLHQLLSEVFGANIKG